MEDPETNEMTLVPVKRIRLRPAVSIIQEGGDDDDWVAPHLKSRQEEVRP